MLEELKKISERMSGIGEMSAVFSEYRKTQHERFNQIHEQTGDMVEKLEKLDIQVQDIRITMATWRSNLKLWCGIGYVLMTLSSAILATYAQAFLKALTLTH